MILLKERLDTFLVNKGFFPTREKAKASIMAGLVFVDGKIADKAGMPVKEDAGIKIKDILCPYVSRGGLKLEKAMNLFNINLSEALCMDIGASTGGFTDCMLKNGANKVYAVDVGYGQLDWKLRNDSRVENHEKTNIRHFDTANLKHSLDFISIDVSFISLKLVLPVVKELLKENGSVLCLVKPQFEAGREQVGKKGIVRDMSVHEEVIRNVISYGETNDLYYSNLTYSPITGAKGNIEFLLHMVKKTLPPTEIPSLDSEIKNCVMKAHEQLTEVEK